MSGQDGKKLVIIKPAPKKDKGVSYVTLTPAGIKPGDIIRIEYYPNKVIVSKVGG